MRYRTIWVYLSVTLCCIAFVWLINFRVASEILNEDAYIAIENFQLHGEEEPFMEFKIQPGAHGIYRYSTSISASKLDKDKDYALIVTRLRGTWHKIYFNQQLIGMIGDSTHTSQHVWNRAYTFFLDHTLIERDNHLTFETYSDYKLGLGNLPILLVPAQAAAPLANRINLLLSTFYLVIVCSLILLSSILIIIFLLSKYLDLRYALLPVAVILIAIYLLDYLIFSYHPLSPLLVKKILLVALYLSVLLASYLQSTRLNRRLIWRWSLGTFTVSVLFILSAGNLLQLNTYYIFANLFMLMQAILWLFFNGLAFYRRRYEEDLLFLIATIALVLPTTFDALQLFQNRGGVFRTAVFGFIFYALAILIIAFKHYINAQRQLYTSSQKLHREKISLQSALVCDELTGLGNHRSCIDAIKEHLKHHVPFAIIFIDIDKFRNINNAFGHPTGDEILVRIGTLLEASSDHHQVFRFGGEEFVMIYEATAVDQLDVNAYTFSEDIRQKIHMDDALGALGQFHPVTISIGIALSPQHSSDAQTLINYAERACEFAKACGRNTVQTYSEAVQVQLQGFAKIAVKQELLNDFILTLAATIDLKDTYTGKHSENVARYASLLGDALGLTHQERYALRTGSLLHDLGKIAIADDILHKSGPLTYDEYILIQGHTVLGANLVSQVVDNPDVINCVKHHHEKYDGTGYPDGLAGEEIPKFARLVAIADAFHAMISDRSYRKGLTIDEALLRLEEGAKTHFDPHLVEIFVACIKRAQGEREDIIET